MTTRSSLLVALAALTALTGCATAPEPFEIGDTLEVKATVTQLDVATRLMTLRGPAGNEFTFEVDPAVRNLPQVKVGDDVSVAAANGKTYLLTLTEVDGEKIVGIGDNKKVTIRYEQIESLQVRKLSAAKSAGLSAGVLATVAVVVVALAAISFQSFINDQDGDGE